MEPIDTHCYFVVFCGAPLRTTESPPRRSIVIFLLLTMAPSHQRVFAHSAMMPASASRPSVSADAQGRQAAVALRRALAGSAVCCGSSVPSPACGGGTGRGHTDSVWKITPSRPHPNPPPQAGEGAHRVRGTAMNGKLIDAHCYFIAICGAPLRTTGWISLCSPQVLQDRGRSLHC